MEAVLRGAIVGVGLYLRSPFGMLSLEVLNSFEPGALHCISLASCNSQNLSGDTPHQGAAGPHNLASPPVLCSTGAPPAGMHNVL